MTNAFKTAKRLGGDELRQNVAARFQPAVLEAGSDTDDRPAGWVEGWASTDSVDRYASVFHTGAFSESIARRGLTGPTGVKFMIGHNREKPAGKIEILEYRGDRLFIAAQFGLVISYVRDFYEAAKMQGGFNFSILALIEEYYFDKDDVLHITKADLQEISAVPFPGNDDCVMTVIRSEPEDIKTVADFEKLIIERGWVKSRRDANQIVRVTKTCADLFRTGKTAREATKNEKKPLLAEPEIEALAEELRQIRAIFQQGQEI